MYFERREENIGLQINHTKVKQNYTCTSLENNPQLSYHARNLNQFQSYRFHFVVWPIWNKVHALSLVTVKLTCLHCTNKLETNI